MSEYTLFGQVIAFDDAAERFLDLQVAAWGAMDQAERDFLQWYEGCGNIEAVVNNGRNQVDALIARYATDPLFAELKQLEFYDISRAAYEKQCVDRSEIYAALTEVENRYNEILNKKSEQVEYRAERKASRERYVSGRYVGAGALKGAAGAGALNMLSGAGHSLFNAVGNLGSSLEASSSKSALYTSAGTQNRLVTALRTSILAIFVAHLNYVNELTNEQYRSTSFSSDKADALLDSAKSVPEKRKELLVRSFTMCPYNCDVLKYIFENYEEERKNIWNIGKRCGVDLLESVEEVIRQIYSPEAHVSADAMQAARQKILDVMAEYELTANATLDELDRDYLSLLCKDLESADKETCYTLRSAISTYDTSDEIKAPFASAITDRMNALDRAHFEQLCLQYGYDPTRRALLADESACNELLEKIEDYDAAENTKKPYIDLVHARIDAIWTEEDFERFKELYLQTPVTDVDSIAKNIEVVEATGRTRGKELFIQAFSNLDPQNVKLAAEYGFAKEKGGLAIVTKVMKISIYKKLTLDGKIIHPDIQAEIDNIKSTQPESRGNGLFGGLFGGKKS